MYGDPIGVVAIKIMQNFASPEARPVVAAVDICGYLELVPGALPGQALGAAEDITIFAGPHIFTEKDRSVLSYIGIFLPRA